MAKKTTQKKDIDYENLREEDILEEVKVTFDRNSWRGPFTCHNRKTIRVKKKKVVAGTKFDYEVWQCPKCKEQYVDSEQAKQLEKIWLLEKNLEEKAIEVKRKINFDGKTFFLRFPKEITKRWHKGATADIKILNSDEFIVKINN